MLHKLMDPQLGRPTAPATVVALTTPQANLEALSALIERMHPAPTLAPDTADQPAATAATGNGRSAA